MLEFLYKKDVIILSYKIYDRESVNSILPDRKTDSHKGDYGRILLLCGSVGYTGAAALCALGALRSGAGLVYVGVPKSIYHIEAVKLTEAIVFPLPDRVGMFASSAIKHVSKILGNMDAVLLGPGVNRGKGVEKLLLYVLKNFCGPVILDADGINLICNHKDVLRGRKYPTILTPHVGEFIRLGGKLTESREEDASSMARELNSIILLKGHETFITDGCKCICTRTGNPGMATGGSGDVLAGIIASFVGQGIPCLEAAACAAWLAGAAGDLCAEKFGQYGMLPSDVLSELPRLMK